MVAPSKKNSKVATDPEVLAKMQNLEAAPEFADYEEEKLDLPPYWVTDVGKSFAARVLDLDDRDPDFPRYVLEAMAPIECQSGPRDEAEDVRVEIGDYFTCSTYAGLPLERYIGCRVLVKCVDTRKTSQPKPMFVFKMTMHPEDKKMVLDERKAIARVKMQQFRESRKNALALPAKGGTSEANA
jgi:hypothetical protein